MSEVGTTRAFISDDDELGPARRELGTRSNAALSKADVAAGDALYLQGVARDVQPAPVAPLAASLGPG
jgi:hypothetical protein